MEIFFFYSYSLSRATTIYHTPLGCNNFSKHKSGSNRNGKVVAAMGKQISKIYVVEINGLYMCVGGGGKKEGNLRLNSNLFRERRQNK